MRVQGAVVSQPSVAQFVRRRLARPAIFWHSSIMQKPKKHEFSVIVERDEAGYFVASVPKLPGCHTQARSLDKLIERVREAIELCLEAGRL